MQMVDLNFKMNTSKNPRLINALDKSINQPLIKKTHKFQLSKFQVL